MYQHDRMLCLPSVVTLPSVGALWEQCCRFEFSLAMRPVRAQASRPAANIHPALSRHTISTHHVPRIRAPRRWGHQCQATLPGTGLKEQGFAPPKDTGSIRGKALQEQTEVYDKLISAFQSKPKKDWRKLIAFSKKWPKLADGVFKRCAWRFLDV
jgi:hypothetical protein